MIHNLNTSLHLHKFTDRIPASSRPYKVTPNLHRPEEPIHCLRNKKNRIFPRLVKIHSHPFTRFSTTLSHHVPDSARLDWHMRLNLARVLLLTRVLGAGCDKSVPLSCSLEATNTSAFAASNWPDDRVACEIGLDKVRQVC